jgi:hypothetical protein
MNSPSPPNLIEVRMLAKTLILPERKRVLTPPFAWIDRRLLLNGFLAELSQHENLLYFFLVLAADRDGLSFYSYDKICQLLKLDVDDYIQARNGLIEKGLIAFDGRQFQVLALPKMAPRRTPPPVSQGGIAPTREAESLVNIFARLAKGGAQ